MVLFKLNIIISFHGIMAFTLSLEILKATARRITGPVTKAKLKEELRSKWGKIWVCGDKNVFENLLF